MYKNQLQELAQRSCFNLPSYTCIREGPDHAPRFKATVNFNGENYECPNYCTTLSQAEHSAAQVALNALASRGPANSLAARILDETGVYKNLLQEVSQRVGASLPTYTTSRSGLGHLPIFTCTVELAGITFTGEPAKNKKQAEKNAAMAAWLALKQLVQQSENSSPQKVNNDEQEHVTVARALQKYRVRAKISNTPFPIRFPMPKPRSSSTQPSPATTSKILPLICSKKAPRNRPVGTTICNTPVCPNTIQSRPINTNRNEIFLSSNTSLQSQLSTTVNERPSSEIPRVLPAEIPRVLPQKFPAAGAAPYIPVRHLRPAYGIAPPVTIRNAIPAYSAPPLPPPSQSPHVRRPPAMGIAPPVCIRQAVPAYAAPIGVEDSAAFKAPITPSSARVEDALPASKALISPPVRVDIRPSLRSPIIPMNIRGENPSTLKIPTTQGVIQVENPPIIKAPLVASTVCVENRETPNAFTTPAASPSTPVEEMGRAAQAEFPESLVVEDLKELKV